MALDAVVLTSGGVDSAVTLALAEQQRKNVKAVNFHYGQITSRTETSKSYDLAEHFGAHHEVVNLEHLFEHIEMGTVNHGRTEFVSRENEMETGEYGTSGYVPMRNLIFLSTGAAIAFKEGYDEVWLGVQRGEGIHVYPDTSQDFTTAAQNAINESIPEDHGIGLGTPLVRDSKAEVVEKGEALGVPWDKTYSCYLAPPPCGECPACKERAEAFEEAGVHDPVMEGVEVQ